MGETQRNLSASPLRAAAFPFALCALVTGLFSASCGGERRPVRPSAQEIGDGGDSTDESESPPNDGQSRRGGVDIDFSPLRVRSRARGVVRFEPERVRREATSKPVITLEGESGLVLDLEGLELRGQHEGADLDAATGVGILIRGCDDIEIRGGLIGGYKVCIAVEDSKNVRLNGIVFDGWYGQRLRSSTFVEDLSDWLRPRENDNGEWVSRYGGAISALRSESLVIAGCRGRRGQNGILLSRCDHAKVYDNDFSFLSGWGIGLFRASDNVVSHNIFDYCVRGYSHDVYWRGQDSCGILLFEQSNRNLIARNSATHSGNGVYLYAGDDLVLRGVPSATGSDHNIIWRNDLRYAVANGLEATFSRGNAVLENDLSGAHQHGLWGGYSSDMVVIGNVVRGVLGPAISIEHGQGCILAENVLAECEVGVEAWWDRDPEFVDGAFGRLRDTDSRGHWIVQNRFENNVLDLVVRQTLGLVFHGNKYVPGRTEAYFESVGAENDVTLDARTVQRWLDGLDGAFPSGNLSTSTISAWTGRPPAKLTDWRSWQVPENLPGNKEVRAEKRDEASSGLESIVIGEWGPWDFRSGLARPIVPRSGGLLEEVMWDATWFRWENGTSDPRTAESVWRSRATAPIIRRRTENFINPWGTEEVRRKVGNDFFGLFASTTFVTDEDGDFIAHVTSDDGVRLFVDEELVLERWSLHASQRDSARIALEAGEHTLRLEYFQVQGAAALVVEISPVEQGR